jgi:gluconate 5-dehydrogenase
MGNQLFDLSGKVALITGAAQGIGFAIGRGFARAGATVVLNGRSEEKIDRALARLREEHLTASGCIFDLVNTDLMRERVGELEKQHGRIDVLVNNAGIQRRSPMEQFEEKIWREVLDTNLTGLFLVTQQVARGMIARKSGKIINICSLMCELARPTVTAYTAAKGGVKMLTKAMAVELAKHNIQVNGLGPGYVTTEMNRPLFTDEKFDGWVRGRTPAGRWADPDDLVGAAIFFASQASDFVNGQILYVDGGILAAL